MTPLLTRIIVPTTAPTLLVASDDYRRRVSIMYHRVAYDDGVPLLYVFTKNTVQNTVGGNGIFVLPAMQFQVEIDKKDFLMAIASDIASQNPENGIEVSVVVETLEDDAPVETTRIGGESR
jgi:hypothetical protein